MIRAVEDRIRKKVARPLHGKRLLWKKRIRVYCDGGQPIFRWMPRPYRMGYAKHWGLRGFWTSWLGRQFFFSFGEDQNGCYAHCHTDK